MDTAVAVLAVAGGLVVVGLTLLAAVASFVVPRGVQVRLTRIVFLALRRLLGVRRHFARTPEAEEEVLAWFAPLGLLALVATWLLLLVVGFAAVFWGLGVGSVVESFEASGSSLVTLGMVGVSGAAPMAAAFTEAALGILLLALLITYLPTMYASFQRRESLVTRAALQAGEPPSGVALLLRFHEITGFHALEAQVWEPWMTGFIELEESHTSLAALPFFRSPRPARSWVTAAGAILDAASLRASTVDAPREPSAELCIRAGYLALRHISDFYVIPYDNDPHRGDPISVTREEWEAARGVLGGRGVPLREDVDEAWLDFAGWRVNYDAPLIALAGLVSAPDAPWSSDRVPSQRHRPPVLRSRSRGTGG